MHNSCTFDADDELSYEFGDLTRDDVKEYLNEAPIGTFLIRNSIRDLNQKVLCVKEAPKCINNYKIIQTLDNSGSLGYFILGKNDISFKTIPDILRFYSTHYLNQSPLIKPAFQHKKVVTLYDFLDNPDDPTHDLYFHKDEILTITDKTEFKDWLKAKNSCDEEGLVPCNLLRRLKINDPLLQQTQSSKQGARILINIENENTRKELNLSIESEKNYYYSEGNYGGIIECPFDAKVIQDYTPSPYELSHITLKKGQVVRVLEAKATGTWFGEISNTKGFFPFNRVEIISNRQQQVNEEDTQPSETQ